MDWEHFWWNNVYGPRSFTGAIAEHAISGRSVLLVQPAGGVPWREGMREAVKERIEQSGIMNVRFLVFAEEIQPDEAIGDFLIRRYTNGDGYRPHSENWWDYLGRSASLNSSLIWIYDISNVYLAGFRDVCRRLKGICSFVIECASDSEAVAGLEIMSPVFSEYDYLLLASQAVSERDDINDAWRCYLSDLAAEIHAGNAEAIVEFVGQCELSVSPDEVDENIAGASIWKAQLRNFYHIVEAERLKLIDRYRAGIVRCLPEMQYSSEVTDPIDVELGLLMHLADMKRESMGKERLVLSYADYDHLRFLRNVRNKLAHNDILAPQEMDRLFGIRN